jgi:hypothetical protein
LRRPFHHGLDALEHVAAFAIVIFAGHAPVLAAPAAPRHQMKLT